MSIDVITAAPPQHDSTLGPGQVVAMHVCFLKPGHRSGYETRVLDEAAVLVRAGVRVVLACFVPAPAGPDRSPADLGAFVQRIQTATGALVYALPTRHFFDLAPTPEGATEIVEPLIALARWHRVQIVHAQALYAVMHALRLQQDTAVRVVWDVHGLVSDEAAMGGAHAARVRTLAAWEAEALQSTDLRVFVSRRMHDVFAERHGAIAGASCIVPCCVHSARFMMHPDRRRAGRIAAGVADRFVVLYLGTLSVWQWPEAMFGLVRQLQRARPDTFFQLILPAADHPRALDLLRLHGLPADGYTLADSPHDKVASLVGLADAGLLLRERHAVNLVSSPTKFGEYAAAGVPVIATPDIGDTSDLIERERTGIVVSAGANGVSPADLARVLAFAEEVMSQRESWAARCRDVAREQLDWRVRIGALIAAYRILADTPRPQPPRRSASARTARSVERLREVVTAVAPPGARVLVISKGDESLIALDGRAGWHFPQDTAGGYAGHYPADSAEAVAHLESLRARGADFLAIPSTALWWLDHYGGFGRHLEGRYRFAHRDDACLMVDLRVPRSHAG